MAQDWDIRPRADVCAVCERPFEDGQTYVSARTFGEEGYGRADHHGQCWTEPEASSPSPPFSVWRGVFRAPPPPEEEVLKKETAESLLRTLVEEEDARHANVIYILAVMLERKRLLVERDVEMRDDGQMIRVYEHRKTGETFLVPEPNIRIDQLEEVQDQVIAMLGGEKPTESAGV